jgi:hypothetical protein
VSLLFILALFFAQDQYPPNAYLRPGGEATPEWVELALPSGRYLIQADCALTPWTEVNYHTSSPQVAGVNDCPLNRWVQTSTEPCAEDSSGVCDLTLDQSYQDFLSQNSGQ